MIPKKLRHWWLKSEGKPGQYVCAWCDMWTANKPLYELEICSSKDRRKDEGDRRRNRR
jgi:hypothetical protein